MNRRQGQAQAYPHFPSPLLILSSFVHLSFPVCYSCTLHPFTFSLLPSLFPSFSSLLLRLSPFHSLLPSILPSLRHSCRLPLFNLSLPSSLFFLPPSLPIFVTPADLFHLLYLLSSLPFSSLSLCSILLNVASVLSSPSFSKVYIPSFFSFAFFPDLDPVSPSLIFFFLLWLSYPLSGFFFIPSPSIPPPFAHFIEFFQSAIDCHCTYNNGRKEIAKKFGKRDKYKGDEKDEGVTRCTIVERGETMR